MSGFFRSFEKNSHAIYRKGSGKATVLMALQPIYFLTKQFLKDREQEIRVKRVNIQQTGYRQNND